jgi:hypothetical protein
MKACVGCHSCPHRRKNGQLARRVCTSRLWDS